MNAESQERLFSQAKHIGLKATSHKPENVLPTILICMQARQKVSDCQQSICKQDSVVSEAASKIGKYRGTFITNTFILNRVSSWQAHLMRISSYLKHGEGVWWQKKDDGFQFNDGADDLDFHSTGPHLDHFRSTTLPDVYRKMSQDWDIILQEKVKLPSPRIRVYNTDGHYQYSTSSLSLPTPFSDEWCTTSNNALQISPSSSDAVETTLHNFQTSSVPPTDLQVCEYQSDPSELHEPAPLSQNQADYVHVPPIELHVSPHQPTHQTSSIIQQPIQNPIPKEKNEYETLLVKLQSRILSIKYVTKDELKTLEKQYMASGGLETDHLQSSTEYQVLYKKLQLIKKVLSIWKTFEI